MEVSQSSPPVDRHKLVYIIFVWLGVGTLLPWNFFITQTSYWNYRYRDLKCQAPNATQDCEPNNEMQKMWNSKMAVASMIPNVTMLILNAVFGHRFKTQPRLLVSLVLVIILFAVTAGLAKIETDSWQSSFMTLTLVTVVFINLNAAIFQGGLAGVVGRFPSDYIGAVYSGQAISGIFASVTCVIIRILRDRVEKENNESTCKECAQSEAFFCFLIAVSFLIVTLILYIRSTRSKFYQFYFQDEINCVDIENTDSNEIEKILSSETSQLLKNDHNSSSDKTSYAKELYMDVVNSWNVSKNIRYYALSIWLTFAISLSCFPAITVLYNSVNGERYPNWSENYFILVCCFVLFNVGDYVGRFIAEKVQWPKPGKINQPCTVSSIIVLVLSLARLVFIPLFMYCNAFESDTVYIVIMLLFSLSNGYLSNICMMSGPQVCHPDDQMTAASLMVACLGIGLATGAALSNLFVAIAPEFKTIEALNVTNGSL